MSRSLFFVDTDQLVFLTLLLACGKSLLLSRQDTGQEHCFIWHDTATKFNCCCLHLARPPRLELFSFLTANAKQLCQLHSARRRHLAEANLLARTPLGQCQPTRTLKRSEVQRCGLPQNLSSGSKVKFCLADFSPPQNRNTVHLRTRHESLPPSHRQQRWQINSGAYRTKRA